MPRLLGSVEGEMKNIEVSEEILAEITKLAMEEGIQRFYYTSKMFSHLDREEKPINEGSVKQYLEERINTKVCA